MIKVWYLVAIIWNGGVGPEGVFNHLSTYSTLENCQAALPSLKARVEADFPTNPYHLSCKEVEIVQNNLNWDA